MKTKLPLLILGGLAGACWWLSKAPPSEKPLTVAPQSRSIETRVMPAATAEEQPSLPVAAPTEDNAGLTEQLARTLGSSSATERDRALNQLLPRLVAQNPAVAGHLALAWETGSLRAELLAQVIRLWTEQDVGGALTWLTSLLDAADRRAAAVVMVNTVAQSDRAGALDLVRYLEVGLDDGSAERMAQLWAEEEPQAAVGWVLRQPAGNVRDRLLARIVHVRAQQDPVEAARLVANEFSAASIRDQATLAVVRQWALRDAFAASEWVGAFPAGPLRESAVAELTSIGRTQHL